MVNCSTFTGMRVSTSTAMGNLAVTQRVLDAVAQQAGLRPTRRLQPAGDRDDGHAHSKTVSPMTHRQSTSSRWRSDSSMQPSPMIRRRAEAASPPPARGIGAHVRTANAQRLSQTFHAAQAGFGPQATASSTGMFSAWPSNTGTRCALAVINASAWSFASSGTGRSASPDAEPVVPAC